MFQYISKSRKEIPLLTSFHIEQIDGEENKEAEELTQLACSLSTMPEGKVTVLTAGSKSIKEEKVLTIIEDDDWRNDIILYLQTGG